MKKSLYIMSLIAVGAVAYFAGTTQAETITETVTIEKPVEVVPNGYIDTHSQEFANYYIDLRQIVDWNSIGDEIAIITTDDIEYYAYRSENIYHDESYYLQQPNKFTGQNSEQ